MVLTSSGGHLNTYGWQAGGTHPTRMLSCYEGHWEVTGIPTLPNCFAPLLTFTCHRLECVLPRSLVGQGQVVEWSSR